jgi:hypothetical protein
VAGRFRRYSLLLSIPLLGAFVLGSCTRPPAFDGPQRTGTLPRAVGECSGLAASRRDPDMLWTHNDSGGQPVLYALGPTGERRGDLRIAGIVNRDWEDLASFELDSRAWLLIADTGDNAGNRTDCALYVVAEPDPRDLSPLAETVAPVAWTIPVRFPDGPRDCEAVAVDARAGLVYLLAKRTSPHGLYTVPLRPSGDGSAPPASLVARFPNASIPQPTATQSLMPIPSGRFRAQPTGMDFAADGSAAVIVSYGDVLVFPRQPDESWPSALLKPPVVLAPHHLAQAEGVAFSADGRTIYVSSERDNAPILRYRASK